MRTLERIAAALGVPAAELLDDSKGNFHLVGATELLQIWCDLRKDTDRRKVLSFARAVVARRSDDG